MVIETETSNAPLVGAMLAPARVNITLFRVVM
jgi:hypothetical protein